VVNVSWAGRLAHVLWGIATSALAVAGVHSLAFIYFLLFIIYEVLQYVALGDVPTEELVEYGFGLLIGTGVGLWLT
jgi:hypothetical protein